MVDVAREHEERALEHRVSDQIEHAGRRCVFRAEARHHHHQAERGDRRIGEHQLEVGLADRQQGAHDQRGTAEDRQNGLPGDRVTEGRVHPHDEIDTRFHHGGRVQIGRNRRRRFHGIGQPEMERELRGLGERTAEQQDQRHQVERACPHLVAEIDQKRELGHAGDVPDHQEPCHQRQAAEAGDDQRL